MTERQRIRICESCNGKRYIVTTKRWDGHEYDVRNPCESCGAEGWFPVPCELCGSLNCRCEAFETVTPSGHVFYVTNAAQFGGPAIDPEDVDWDVLRESAYDEWDRAFGMDDPNVKASEQYYGSVYR